VPGSPAVAHLLALLTTLVVECSIAALIFATSSATRPRVVRFALLVAGVNLVTHSIFWYTLALAPGGGLPRLYAYEAAIVVLEGALYARFGHIRLGFALLVSLLANAASFCAGIILTFAH
jgi:hypothetical protein